MTNPRYTALLALQALACVVAGSAVASHQIDPLAASVALHYPQLLVDESLEITGHEPPRKQCFGVLERTPSGAPKTVVAGYTNLLSGAVRLLRAAGEGFTVIAAPDFGDVTGWGCEVETIDLTGDGRLEAVVRFTTRESSVDWIFGWDGASFNSVSPTTTGVLGLVNTALMNTSFADLDGDGVLEIFTASAVPREGPPQPGMLYRLSGDSYIVDRRIVAMGTYARAPGSAETEAETIPLPVGAVGPLTIRIYNGAGLTGGRAKREPGNAQVWWNRQRIVGPDQLESHVSLVERTVTAQEENELKVRFDGAGAARITIVIDAATWTR